jgi:glycosyltransferase involved in cell wall biosynthesis
MRDRVASYVASFDIALQPDVVEYASPLKLFEYLALGKTIIAPPKKNIMEILNDGVNGILMSFDSPELPGCIERLRQQPSLKEEYYHAALQTILGKELTWEKNAEVVSRLFSQLEK